MNFITLAEPYSTWLLILMISSLVQLGWTLTGLIVLYIVHFQNAVKWISGKFGKVSGVLGSVYRYLLTTRAVRRLVNGLGYDYDAEQDIFYSTHDAWQRQYGYCRLYDEAAVASGMIVDCEPIPFDYNGKHWLIELWKGQYDLSMGFEIGVYNTSGPYLSIPDVFNGSFYQAAADSELLHMSATLYKDSVKLFAREDTHWWLTAFKVGEFADPSELSLDVKITLASVKMRDAFITALKAAGYGSWEIKASGNTVSFVFENPRTQQPFTRTKELESFMQWKNKALCDVFQSMMGGPLSTPRRIDGMRKKEADIYQKIREMGRPAKSFEFYKTLKPYLENREDYGR